jgi:hypothetical protein
MLTVTPTRKWGAEIYTRGGPARTFRERNVRPHIRLTLFAVWFCIDLYVLLLMKMELKRESKTDMCLIIF